MSIGVTHRTTSLYHFDQLPIDPIKILCLQQEKWLSGGKTFDILCLFCRSYELMCAWKGWLYVSLWKLLFVLLYYWNFGGLWTTCLQIIMSKFNVMNFHHLFHLMIRSNAALCYNQKMYCDSIKMAKLPFPNAYLSIQNF